MKIDQYLDTNVAEMETSNPVEISHKFQKRNPSFAWIFKNSFGGSFLKLISESWLRGQYNCHLVENVGGRMAFFDRIHVSMAGRIKDVLQRLREGGFEALWRKWDDIGLYYWRLQSFHRERHGDFISFLNLLSFAIVVGILFTVVFFTWVFELYVCTKFGKVANMPVLIEVEIVRVNDTESECKLQPESSSMDHNKFVLEQLGKLNIVKMNALSRNKSD